MTTSADVYSSRTGVSMSDRDEQARRAVKAFRALQPTLTAYARVLTKRPNVRVEMAVRDNGSTDGTKIYYRPPMALGEQVSHERRLCDRRDEFGIPQCRACANREGTLVTIYHEIAHICFDSFAEVTEEDRARLIEEAVKEAGGKYAERISARIDSAPPYVKRSYIGMSSLVSEFLPLLVNCLEDARVNRELFKARKGTKVMFDANTAQIFREGVEQRDPITGEIISIAWNKYPLNMQAMVGVFCKASGYDYSGWFAPQVVEALNDAELTNLVRRIDTVRSASGVYNLSFPVLARLRELGFCKLPDDPEEPDAPPTEEPEPGSAPQDDTDSDDPESGDGAPDPDAAGGGQEDDGEGVAPGGGDDGEREPSGPPAADGDDESDGAPGPDGGPGDGDSDEEAPDGEGDAAEGEPAGEADPGQDDRGDGGEGEESGGPSDGDAAPSNGDGSGADADAADAGDAGAGSAEDERDAGDASGEDAADGAGGSADADLPDEGGPEAGSAGAELDSDEGGPVDDDASAADGSAGSADADGPPRDEELGDGGEQASERDSDEEPAEAGEDAGITGTGDIGPDKALDEGTGGEQDADRGGSDSAGTDAESGGMEAAPEGGSDEVAGDSVGDGPDGSSPDVLGGGDGEPSDQPDERGGERDLPEVEDDDELIDTGADDGTGGVMTEDSEDPPLEYGTPDDAKAGLLKWGDHEEKPRTAEVAREDDALEKAIVQGIYFETPSKNIRGVREHRYGVPQEDENGYNFSRAWDDVYGYLGYSSRALGKDGDFMPSESILGPALLRMRVAFSDNARGKIEGNRRSGRVNGKVLGKRAPLEDGRLFRKKSLPGKKSYFVVIGMDVSGSTVGTNIALEKAAVMAQAMLLSRMGIPFAVFAHSGNHHNSRNGAQGIDLDIYMVKEPHEPWDDKVQKRLKEIGPDAANIDGHTLEYYRKVLDRQDATDKVIMYYTDGKMPAENHDEELDILQRELRICKQKGYTVLGVGIRTDSPVRHGLDTVQVDSEEDVTKVVKHLEKRLLA